MGGRFLRIQQAGPESNPHWFSPFTFNQGVNVSHDNRLGDAMSVALDQSLDLHQGTSVGKPFDHAKHFAVDLGSNQKMSAIFLQNLPRRTHKRATAIKPIRQEQTVRRQRAHQSLSQPPLRLTDSPQDGRQRVVHHDLQQHRTTQFSEGRLTLLCPFAQLPIHLRPVGHAKFHSIDRHQPQPSVKGFRAGLANSPRARRKISSKTSQGTACRRSLSVPSLILIPVNINRCWAKVPAQLIEKWKRVATNNWLRLNRWVGRPPPFLRALSPLSSFQGINCSNNAVKPNSSCGAWSNASGTRTLRLFDDLERAERQGFFI